MTMSITFDAGAVAAQLKALQADVQQALRPAAQAGAQVLYNQVKINAAQLRSAHGHWFHGTSFKVNGKKYWFEAGTLQKSVYQAYATKEARPLRPVYSVGFNPRLCPYGYMVELGTSRARGAKFVGRAVAQMPAALEAAASTFYDSLRRFQ